MKSIQNSNKSTNNKEAKMASTACKSWIDSVNIQWE